MLKLEKNKKHRNISVRIRKRDRFLTRGFLVSLTVTILLHAFAACIFHVSIFRYPISESSISPISVEAFTDDTPAIAITNAEERKHNYTYNLKPKPSKLKVPTSLPPDHSPLFLTLNKNEDNFFEDSTPNFSEGISLTLKCAQAEIFGTLSDEKLIDAGAERIPIMTVMTPISFERAVYEVKMDRQTGVIFWKTPLIKPTSRQKETLAHQLINSMRFEKKRTFDTISGYIEILFPSP